LLEPARVFVATDQVEQAKELLKDFEVHLFGFSNQKIEMKNKANRFIIYIGINMSLQNNNNPDNNSSSFKHELVCSILPCW